MANLDFRSDVSMQDADVPKLVLFYLVPKALTVAARPPVPAPFLEQFSYKSKRTIGSQSLLTSLTITCDQDAPLDQPADVLSIGSDPHQCGLILDRRHADPKHCQISAQLNSGFDVWILQDDSTVGTHYRRLRETTSPRNTDMAEELEAEELIHKGCKAIQGLRYIKIGPYEFHCRPSKDRAEIVERNQWFRRHEPIPVSSQMLRTQLAGRLPDIQERKSIGEGGFGEVFKYMEMQTGLLVAVKKQKVGNDRGVGNVLREVRSMEKLDHRNVVRILYSSEESPEDGQRVFHLVMPLFPCSLRNALPKMKAGNKRNAMIQMVEGLKYIHRSGFLHRDIKPENIFISEQTPTNIVLGDLGLLSPVGAIGRMAGTKIYKAPEVYYEDRQTTAIDVYALGVTFLQMLDDRAIGDGRQGLKQWVENLWDHPPPSPFSRLIIQMTAPYPHTLRPSLDTIQALILQHTDLPESVKLPEIDLNETMRMLKQKHAPPPAITPQGPMAVPVPVPVPPPAPLQTQVKRVKPRLGPQDDGLNAGLITEKPIIKKAGPLDLVHRARGHASGEQPAAAPRELKPPGLKQDLHCAISKPVPRRSKQRQSPQRVDFTKVQVEPGNIFARQKIELLEAQLKVEKCMRELERGQMRLAEGLRSQRRECCRCEKDSKPRREHYPGEWPSHPTYPGAGSFSRLSQFSSDASHDLLSSLASSDLHSSRSSHHSRGGRSSLRQDDRPGRPARARISTRARYSERTSKRDKVSFQRKMLEGLTLALKTSAGGIGNTLSKSIRWMLGNRAAK